MKKQMIFALSFTAGILATNLFQITHHKVNDLMLGSTSHNSVYDLVNQEETGPGEISSLIQVPPGMSGEVPPPPLPLDATPTPGSTPEPGSARPKIIARPSASLVLKKSNEVVPNTKDPVWNLMVVDKYNQVLHSMNALTGRANRQSSDRNVAGNKSPLPKGAYAIDEYGIAAGPFPDPELGKGYWIPIMPLFNTNRSALGFHQDPSWGKMNGESGTSGCIGLENAKQTAVLLDWIRQYRIKKLTVES